MKSASLFEIVAARCWNVLNEGKSFTPIFVLAVFLLVQAGGLEAVPLIHAILLNLPLFVILYVFDYPLHLRWFLIGPLLACSLLYSGSFDISMWIWAFGLYAFFTVFFWGTLYYHLRIGTTWWNFTQIWKLFLKNSDSTSGNVFEQLPKVFILLVTLDWSYRLFSGQPSTGSITQFLILSACVGLYSWLLHRLLFTWKPREYPTFTAPIHPGETPAAKRMIVFVIDGCRKERFEEADAPFLHKLMETGVYYDRMETVYPARTVVCFSSMFTGTYPREHGIRSNMVWKLGVRVESIFDKLKETGRKGILFGCAHLIDAFGSYVESFTAVEKNDVVDHKIMARAKTIMKTELPDLLVIQMIAVDQTGHSRGVLYPEYLEKIKESDALIRDYCEWLEEEGLMEGAAIAVMADHGQGDGIGGHGHLDTGERYVPFLLHGPGIRKGERVQELRSIVSLAPTIASLLGVPLPSHSRGPVLTEAFETGSSDKHTERVG